MGDRRGGGGGRKVLLPPINFIFKLLQQHSTVQIWLYEQLGIRLVVDEAVEVRQITKADPAPETGENGGRRELGT